MTILSLDHLHFDANQCGREGGARHASYVAAAPFPHIVMDDFLPADMLRAALADFPSTNGKAFFDREQERLKYQFKPHEVAPGLLRSLLVELNGEAFLSFLEALTGIHGLIPDPHFEGGGLHETKAGGHLGVHADFNVHDTLRLERRLNLLIYLNDDWDDEFGGELELWDREMQSAQISIKPVMACAVIFNTDRDSFHGQPAALRCPPDRARRSIATYYYTAPENGVASLAKRTTNFQSRPGTADVRDWKIGYFHFVRDWVPFKFQRIALRLIGY
jgi:2OG-Fe(II) oxygenase superfamily